MQQNNNSNNNKKSVIAPLSVVTRSETRFQTAVSSFRLADRRPPRNAAPAAAGPSEMYTRSTDFVTMDRRVPLDGCTSDCANVTFRKRR